jgi:hypothetical protein
MLCRVLPNRQICLVMTPREASMLEGQILDPADFPWQDSETLVVASEARRMLYEAVSKITEYELGNAIGAITQTAEFEEEKQKMEKAQAKFDKIAKKHAKQMGPPPGPPPVPPPESTP